VAEGHFQLEVPAGTGSAVLQDPTDGQSAVDTYGQHPALRKEKGMTTIQRFLGAMAALMFAATTNAQSAPSPIADRDHRLVHGALIDGSSWRGVYGRAHEGRLSRQHRGSPPLTGSTRSGRDQARPRPQDGPVILVGNKLWRLDQSPFRQRPQGEGAGLCCRAPTRCRRDER